MRPWNRQSGLDFCSRGVAITLLAIAQMASGDTEAEYAKLRYERTVERIRTRRAIEPYGGEALWLTFPLSAISPEIRYEPGKVSLVPDPADRGGGKIAVYLINATELPLPGADSVTLQCFQEIKEGDQWRICEVYVPGCGNNPEPKDLPPGHAKIYSATDPALGDAAGELRYCIGGLWSLPVASASLSGRYGSQTLADATPWGRAGMAIRNGLEGKGWVETPDSPELSAARSPVECLAMAELERCLGGFTTTSSELARWKESGLPGEEMARCQTVAKELLNLPWPRQEEGARLIDRCLKALAPRAAGHASFGSPEQCRAMIWRYLGNRRRLPLVFVNPESAERMKKNAASGNPWGADQASIEALLREAEKSRESGLPDEREAAAAFLASSWIKRVH